MKRLNLFVVGAMKSGSTTLHDYLAEHPEIFMSAEKEPGFFVAELWGNKSPTEYEDLFVDATDEKYLGESSTHYTKLPTYPGVAKKIYEYNPLAKILYIVRHPVERTISHYFHNKRDLLYHAETRSIITAIRKDKSYTDYSNYAMQLEPYIRFFGRERIYIVTFEKMISAPQVEMSKVFAWLDVDDAVQVSPNKKSNAAPKLYKVARGFGLLNKLRYSAQWDKLAPLFPAYFKKVGNQIAEKNGKKVIDNKGKILVYQELAPLYQDYIHKLEGIAGISFSDWSL